ncbi:MAG: hypothetical protein KGI41_03660 [Patescibacteria group bacterium]|nr:hypothetical protein [Patescibacteria group bacterium]MDE1966308.1 hypothetical protein [Patescibacteria group bacterium]
MWRITAEAMMREETREKDGRTFHLRYYDGLGDFVSRAERVERGHKGMEFNGMECGSLATDDNRWAGTNSLAEAIAFARRGWPEGRMKMRDMRKRLKVGNLLSNAQRFVTSYDVSGDEPDVGRYLSGEPENMRTQWDTLVPQRGKVIRFLLNRSASCGTDVSRIVRRGVALQLAFETLLKLGYAPEVSISFVTGAGYSRMEQYVPILRAGDPIDLDTLAFMFIQPAVLRRLFLAVTECESKDIRKTYGFYEHGSYGMPQDPLLAPPHDLLMKWEYGLVYSDEEVIPITFDILRRVGIKIDDKAA